MSQNFLELQELVLFCGIKYCLCPGMFWGAINVISNNKCEWSNVENIISSPVKVPLGPSGNINEVRSSRSSSRKGLRFFTTMNIRVEERSEILDSHELSGVFNSRLNRS